MTLERLADVVTDARRHVANGNAMDRANITNRELLALWRVITQLAKAEFGEDDTAEVLALAVTDKS